jgi:hypothetical protein
MIHAHVNTLKVNKVVDVLLFCFLGDRQFIKEFKLPVLILNELLE